MKEKYVINKMQSRFDIVSGSLSPEDQEEGELSREESQEPLAGVHVCLQPTLQEMLPQVWQPFLYQSVQLVEPQLELLEVLSEHVSQVVGVHHLHQHPEGLQGDMV